MADTLNDRMEMDHVIRVDSDGNVTDATDIHAPDLYISCDADGQISDQDDQTMIDAAEREGWTLLTGWTGQYRYNGPLMHASEQVGGTLEKHILSTPGLWFVSMPSLLHPTDDDACCEGWILGYRAE